MIRSMGNTGLPYTTYSATVDLMIFWEMGLITDFEPACVIRSMGNIGLPYTTYSAKVDLMILWEMGLIIDFEPTCVGLYLHCDYC